jgi:hypothetical protein
MNGTVHRRVQLLFLMVCVSLAFDLLYALQVNPKDVCAGAVGELYKYGLESVGSKYQYSVLSICHC